MSSDDRSDQELKYHYLYPRLIWHEERFRRIEQKQKEKIRLAEIEQEEVEEIQFLKNLVKGEY